MAVIGADGTSRIKIRTVKEREESGVAAIFETYKAHKDSVSTIIGSNEQMGNAHPDHSEARLVRISESVGEEFSELTYEFRIIGPRLDTTTADTIRSTSSNLMEVPISLNANYSTAWETSKPGVTSFYMPMPVYERRELKSFFSFSESNITQAVGTRDSPSGMTGSSTDKWLKIEKQVTEIGQDAEVIERWQYNPAGWDTDIYD